MIEERLWLHLASHWDAGRGQFAGPADVQEALLHLAGDALQAENEHIQNVAENLLESTQQRLGEQHAAPHGQAAEHREDQRRDHREGDHPCHELAATEQRLELLRDGKRWRAIAERNAAMRRDVDAMFRDLSPEEAEGIRVSLLSYWLSSQLPFVGIAKRWVTIRDLDAILDHTLGHLAYPGRLGGKAAGMIVAQRILLPLLEHRDPDFERHIAVPDTWYLSSGLFSDFVDRNGFHFFHSYKYQEREEILGLARGIK